MYEARPVKRRSRVIHDFPYAAKHRRCPHAAIINVTKSGHCVFDCKYCYAKSYPWSKQSRFVEVYENTSALLDAELNAIQICPPLYFCAVTDPFQPIDLVCDTSLEAMAVAVKHGVHFTIITKSNLVLKILDTDWRDYKKFRVSFTCESINRNKLRAISNAPDISLRLKAVEKLIGAGIDVSVRVDPLISGLSDDHDELAELLEALSSMGVARITVSTGAFRPRAFTQLLEGISEGGFSESAALIKSRYLLHSGKYTLRLKRRLRLYRDLQLLCGRYGVMLSLCMEPIDLSPCNLTRCTTLGKLAVKDRGHFVPVCDSDCVSNCPNRKNPPCHSKKLLTEYPYRWSTIAQAYR